MSDRVCIRRQEWLKIARPILHISIPQQTYLWNSDDKVWNIIMNLRKWLNLIA